MRILGLLLASTLLAAQPAHAGDKVGQGPVPSWVKRGDAGRVAADTKVDGPLQLLLQDQQVRIEPNAVLTYSR